MFPLFASRRLILAGWAALMCAGLASVAPAQAHGFKLGNLTVTHPHARPTLAGAANGAVYFVRLRNEGAEPEQLLGARTEVAERVELHRMDMEGDVMRMRAVPELTLPPKAEVPFKAGAANGYHLMLLGLKAPLKDGDRFSITLQLRRGGEQTVEVWVERAKSTTDEGAHKH